MLLEYLRKIPDFRRSQGRRYDLASILLVAILASISGANSYRDIKIFCKTHFRTLKKTFDIHWWSVPSYCSIRNIIQGVDGQKLEEVFREYSATLSKRLPEKIEYLACDGKSLRGSFDNMEDKKMAQLLSIFAVEGQLILAHAEIDEKTNASP